nr:glycoside hydrolase family 3 C-terminal domain-containing protein [Bifidobacterium miconisargentati]
MKRSPLCGRNFEYISEDPYLAGRMAAGHINGVQSQGVGTCIKHFAVNNQETNRFTVNADLSERALREIYLPAFETAVREAGPWSIMGSYNKINGTPACQNKHLLDDILRKDWGYEGVTVTDWGAIWDRVEGIRSGLDLQMPYCGEDYISAVVKAVKDGTLDEARLDECARRVLELIDKAVTSREAIPSSCDYGAHRELARRAADESAVLLRNDGLLPLGAGQRIALIGGLAKHLRYQGGGSSNVHPTSQPSLLDSLDAAGIDYTFARGYRVKKDVIDAEYEAEALKAAADADVIVYAMGLSTFSESEGYDRTTLALPNNQTDLLHKLAAFDKPIVVLLFQGSPVELPWIDETNAVLAFYCGGQSLGDAIVDLLYGKANPSGKLAETFPIKLSDTPASLVYPQKKNDPYAEGVFIGYRYYDKKQMDVRFPFGFGLSYTTFEYTNLTVSSDEFADGDTLTVTVDVTNTGKVFGKEIVELYIGDAGTAPVPRPDKELKGFAKVALEPGETRTVSMTLDKRSFSYYNEDIDDWVVAPGTYRVLIGASSRDIRLSAEVKAEGTPLPRRPFTAASTIREIQADSKGAAVMQAMMARAAAATPGGGDPAEQAAQRQAFLDDEDDVSSDPFDAMAMSMDMPLQKTADMSGGLMTPEAIARLLAAVNA